MTVLNIDVERTGFPIKIAGLEFFFDASIEGIEEYERNYQETINRLYEIEETEDALNDRKKMLKEAYDTILGKNAFDKIYKKVPDVIALNNAFFTIVNGIDEHVAKVAEDQAGKVEKLMSEYEDKNNLIKDNQK